MNPSPLDINKVVVSQDIDMDVCGRKAPTNIHINGGLSLQITPGAQHWRRQQCSPV
jgi:hypothetical protein